MTLIARHKSGFLLTYNICSAAQTARVKTSRNRKGLYSRTMIFQRYLFRNLLIATIFISVTLAAVILLTQSLRFLELVINSGASSLTFWVLTALALPRFFELILPIGLMGAVVFIYNKMALDRELVVMRATGASPMALARPALLLALIVTVVLWMMTMWLAPLSRDGMYSMRDVIRNQYSSLLFREGVFTAVRPGLTVFINDRHSSGELHGVLIHDSRPENPSPVTVIARRGVLVSTSEGQQVVVYEGSRQDFNPQSGVLNRLNFSRYTIDLPEQTGVVRQRWQEPSERTFWELLQLDPENALDMEHRREFLIEAHRRIASPLLALTFTLIALCLLLLGPTARRGQNWRIVMTIGCVVCIQAFYLGAFSLARNTNAGLLMMYALTLIPIAGGLYLLGSGSERLRRRFSFALRKVA